MVHPERRSSSPLVARLTPLHGRPTQRAVLAELRRVILAGDAPPGSAIPLDDVATALGMSVIPVRESLKILIAGGNKIYAGWKKKFEEDMDMPSDQKTRQAVERSGQVGFIGKGVSIGVIGVLVVIAAIRFDPAKAAGLDAALRSLTQPPLGPWLLVVVALGLAAYGVFCWFDAKYHRV